MNQQSDNSQRPSEIGNVAIDPRAEPLNEGSSNGLARQEEQFYRQAGEQYKLMQNQQDLGFLGKFFGANSSAPTNIAGFVVAISLLALLVTFATGDSDNLTKGQERLIGLIGTALGFIFGAATKK